MSNVLWSLKTVASTTAHVVAETVVRGKGDRTWDELKAIEKKRREILRRSSLPLIRILFFWDGTCNSILLQDPLVWITLALYIVVRIQARVGYTGFVGNISTSDIGVIGGFLSFFLVFFVVQSNTRFNTMYEKSMSCEGRIFDTATLAKASLPREHGLRLIRYMNAAHVAAYVGLSDTYTAKNFFERLNRSHKFLTRDEVRRMQEIDMDSGGSCYRELLAWCMMEVEHARKAKIIDGRLASDFRERILMFRGSIGALYDFQDQPISFFYVHFLSLLSALYLPLFAISAAYNVEGGDAAFWTSDVLSGLIVLLQIIFVIGLRLLGLKMSDPYGEDLEDLSVMHYIEFTWRMSNRILMSSVPAEINRDGEERMVRRRLPIGDAWEDSDEEEQDQWMTQQSRPQQELDEEQSSRTLRTSMDDSEKERSPVTPLRRLLG